MATRLMHKPRQEPKRKQKKGKHNSKKRTILSPKSKAAAKFSSLNEFLILKVSSPAARSERSSLPLLPELLYNLTPGTKNLAYLSGFSCGLDLSLKHNKGNTINTLLCALENAGFTNIMYYPSRRDLIISAKHLDCSTDLKKNIHTFEAGLIAGYLSESTGRRVNVVERQCAHNSRNSCQFLTERFGKMQIPESYEGVDSGVDAIAKSVSSAKPLSRISDSYYILEMLPLTKGTIPQDLSKLLFIIGAKAAGEKFKFANQNMGNLASLIAARQVKIERKGRGISSIKIIFTRTSSISAYTDLATALMAGIISKAIKKQASISRTMNSDGSYSVTFSL
ncbi:MAG: 4-vinyl reductase [Candidatus Micrarchaeota archaeon]|nr:4-vinyl reductase [Candidatus Micrarchaeota archaeon]MDE1847415.1 4-vinyl reductase [Candidatus Micrarchaeota archaeon]MDE1864090.1 4-vinyl reductase [Candidatus Micrarchaeota archaeon]